MNPFLLVLSLGSLFCFVRAAGLLLSLKQKRAYPPKLFIKRQILLYGSIGAFLLVCMLLFRLFV